MAIGLRKRKLRSVDVEYVFAVSVVIGISGETVIFVY